MKTAKNVETHKKTKRFRKLLEDRLRSLTPISPQDSRYQFYLEYDLRAVDRGKEIVDVLKKYATIKDSQVLDLGCGTGGIALAFALEHAHVAGLDTDESTVRLASARSKEERSPISFLVSDGTMCPFPSCSFDIIICNEVFEHVLDKDKLAHEISRMLKSGGTAYVSAPSKYSPWNILWDDHTGIPFITLMPAKIQNFLVKLFGLSKKGLPFVLRPPTFRSLAKSFERVGIETSDDAMRSQIASSVLTSRTDVLLRSRSNMHPKLTSTLLTMLRHSYNISKLVRLKHFWWILMLSIFPRSILVGKKVQNS